MTTDGPRFHPLLAEAVSAARSRIEIATGADPLARLLDPGYTQVLWEYEHSRTEPMIPGQLHPKQVELLNSPARHRFAFWGNQVGKSTVGAIDVVLTALGRHPVDRWAPPTTQWASALTWELWENILLPELLTWIPRDRIVSAPEPYVHSTKRHILVRADNGAISRITGKAAEQGAAKYQSARIHKAWLDEEHPEAVWNEMQPRLLRHGGRTINTMTPLKGLTWIYQRIYEPWKDGKSDPASVFISHAGLRDNPSVTPEALAALRDQFKHNKAQLAAREEGKFVRPEGLVLAFEPDKHMVTLSEHDARELLAGGHPFGALDFGLWRFAFTLWVPDRDGVLHLIDEWFSQREDLTTRAKALHDLLAKWGITKALTIFGDCANPQDILELNQAFRRMQSPHLVTGVEAENKIIKAGVERVEDLLGRGALKVRRGIGAGRVWRLGWNASRPGDPVEGSRWLWEVNNWAYPQTADGKLQKDKPDDATADGSDMMASTRYAVMTWYKSAPQPPKEPVDVFAPETLAAMAEANRKVTSRKLARRPMGSPPPTGLY